jgi:glutathione S-transferase
VKPVAFVALVAQLRAEQRAFHAASAARKGAKDNLATLETERQRALEASKRLEREVDQAIAAYRQPSLFGDES